MTGEAPRRVVIVGASIAGLSAAEALRRDGFDGSVTLIGDELHAPYDRPPLSKQVLGGEWSLEQAYLRAENHFEQIGVDLVLGDDAVGLDPASRSIAMRDGRVFDFDAALIATGVRPRRLPGSEGVEGVHVMRSAEDAVGLRDRLAPGRRLVVVGAGFLGGEVAAVARKLGADVTVVEPAPVPLAHAVGARVGGVIADLHREHDVDLRTGVGVSRVVAEGGSVDAVELADGTLIPADDVLVAIGSLPNTEWLASSGLEVADGVVCDEFSMAAPGIAAAGDVARWHNPLFDCAMRIEHRTTAAEHGVAAARNLTASDGPRPFAPVPYFWSDQYDVRIQAYGYLRGYDEEVLLEGDLESRRFLMAYRTGDRLTGVLGMGMPPKVFQPGRAAILARTPWAEAIAAAA